MLILMKTPKDMWSNNDTELMKILSDPKILNIIKKI